MLDLVFVIAFIQSVVEIKYYIYFVNGRVRHNDVLGILCFRFHIGIHHIVGLRLGKREIVADDLLRTVQFQQG
ncbi:hypothetical protein D3C81_1813910 [compost metagenome]